MNNFSVFVNCNKQKKNFKKYYKKKSSLYITQIWQKVQYKKLEQNFKKNVNQTQHGIVVMCEQPIELEYINSIFKPNVANVLFDWTKFLGLPHC